MDKNPVDKSGVHFAVPKGPFLTTLKALFDEFQDKERIKACEVIEKEKKILQKPVNK